MRFNEAERRLKESSSPHVPQKRQPDPFKEFADFKLYGNIAVYTMKPGARGNFKQMANLINDGESAPSWAVRLSLLDGKWVVHVAPHPDINAEGNLSEQVAEVVHRKYTVPVLGHLHLGIVETKSKLVAEDVVNILVDALKDRRLDGIERVPINPAHRVALSSGKYRIPTFFRYSEGAFDEAAYRKDLLVIAELVKNPALAANELKEVERIGKRLFKNKILIQADARRLADFTERYVSPNRKIRIALKYLSSAKDDENADE